MFNLLVFYLFLKFIPNLRTKGGTCKWSLVELNILHVKTFYSDPYSYMFIVVGCDNVGYSYHCPWDAFFHIVLFTLKHKPATSFLCFADDKAETVCKILAHTIQLSRGLASSSLSPLFTGSTNNKQLLSSFLSQAVRWVPRLPRLRPNTKMNVIHVLQLGNLRYGGYPAQLWGGLLSWALLTFLTSSFSCFSMQCDCSVPADKICS